MAHTQNIEYGVIGLGRFGYSLAKTLAEAGREVLVLDNDENKIKQIRHLVENAYVVGSLTKDTLEQAGVQNCQTVIVCIAEQLDISILTTLNVISLRVPRVISKAIGAEHGLILEKIGAEVVYPESDMAVRLANKLVSSKILDSIDLNDDINISELKLSARIAGQTVSQANLRGKYDLNIIALEQDGKTTTTITPDLTLHENDKIVVVGSTAGVKKFENFLSGGHK
jgi:trk system potassium uptake protein TrkA